jgi:hypothetical protein
MMENHIFIEKAFIYSDNRKKANMEGYKYNSQKGYWISNLSGLAMVEDNERPKPSTKKADIETGEDAKGE